MNVLPAIRALSELAVSIGVGSVVTNAVKATTPANLNRFSKISVGIGTVVISAAVSELAAKSVVEKIDAAAEKIGKKSVEIEIDPSDDTTTE